MASFDVQYPDDLIKMFEKLGTDTEKMIGDMVKAGAGEVLERVNGKMPRQLKNVMRGDNVRLTRVYKTRSDGGINCQVIIDGYFINHRGYITPAPLVANMFEYGSSTREYPKHPFFRSSFNKKRIETAMLKVQDRYIKGASK